VPVVESAKVRLGQVCRQLAEAESAKYWSGHFWVQLWLRESAKKPGEQELSQALEMESK
jgi:hypothetical protein